MKQVDKLIPGKVFTYAKEKFVVLGPKNYGIHVLRAQSGEDRCAFYEGNEAPYNHYGKSTLREHIEQDFLQKLTQNGANPEDWIPFDLDLSETDGSFGYGILNDVLAAPLTLIEWGMYKDVVPNNEGGPFWLATPFWTPSTPGMYNSRYVWGVNSDGGCNYWNCGNTWGVRPGLILEPFVLVSVEGEDRNKDDGIDWAKVSNKMLIEEFTRRFNKGTISISVNDLMRF